MTVRESNGEQIAGRMGELSSSRLTLLIAGKPRAFREADLDAILQRRGDSLLNGAAWGFIVGAGVMGGILVAACSGGSGGGCDSNDTPYQVFFAALGAATGLGVGIGVDALITGLQVIY